MTTTEPGAAAADDAGRIDGRPAFQRAVLAALDEAAAAGTQQLWWCDPDFASWPLAQPAVLDALSRWANSHRRLILLANDYRLLPQHYPRWMNWRRQWSHIVQCLAVHPEEAASVPALLYLPDRLAVRLYDLARHRGRADRTALELSRSRELLDALTQRAEESFPVTTLGL